MGKIKKLPEGEPKDNLLFLLINNFPKRNLAGSH